MADHIVVMRDGAIAQVDTLDDCSRTTRLCLGLRFVGAGNVLRGTLTAGR